MFEPLDTPVDQVELRREMPTRTRKMPKSRLQSLSLEPLGRASASCQWSILPTGSRGWASS